jgi:curved DNA-binding protein CbpA
MRYHPDRHAGAEPEKIERAAAIYRRGAEAYRVLTDVEQRRRYDEQLAIGKVRYEEPQTGRFSRPPSGPIDVKNLRARPFVQKAIEQLKAGDLKGAKLNLALALNYEPDNAGLLAKLDEVKAKLGS